MGKVTRKRYSAEFKAKLALEALKGEATLAELAAKHGVHQTMIAGWKRQAIEGITLSFSGKPEAASAASPAEVGQDGSGTNLPTSKDQPATSTTPRISVSAARSADHAAQPGLVR